MSSTEGISTDPALLDVELPSTLIESPSVSTFLPEEDASICPLLSSNTNGTTTPLTFSQPLTPCIDNDNDNDDDSNTSGNLGNEDAKVETSSSSGSSCGIGLNIEDGTATALFHKSSEKHLPKSNNSSTLLDSNNHGLNGTLQIRGDTPSFVYWNWPLIRKCTFFFFMSGLLAMCAVVVAMIATLPNTCNPKTAWYRGSVFYEIFPASFQDSNNDGIGDLRGIVKRTDYLKALGVSAVRLNSIFPSTFDYPDNFENISSLMEVAHVLGTLEDIRHLSQSLHARNISLLLDIPLYPILKVLGKSDGSATVQILGSAQANIQTGTQTTARPVITENLITQALQHWVKLGVDGFYIKGLEHFDDLEDLSYHLAEWKDIIGSNRVLIVSEQILSKLEGTQRSLALSHVDLVDVHLNIFNGTEPMENRIKSILASDLAPTDTGIWIHWSLAGVDQNRLTCNKQSANYTLAATIMQLMLPGTPNIFYGDEVALQPPNDHFNEHNETKRLHHLASMQFPLHFTQQFISRETLSWLPQSPPADLDIFITISKMVNLRERSPSIYKNSICKTETALSNTAISRSNDDILIVERTYPRRNTFVSITNFGQKRLTMDMTSMYYSGHVLLGSAESDKIYFSDFKIGSTESIVIRLDK